MAFEVDGVTQYDVEELKRILEEGRMRVIDVRTPEEYELGHIPGVPLRPMQEVDRWKDELDPETDYVLVCRSGNRSQHVALYLKSLGFQRVANFYGGMLVWDGELHVGLQP